MAKKRFKTCPVTGDLVVDRKSNKRATYSKQGLRIHRKEYSKEYHEKYYTGKKLIGIGLLSTEENKK